MRTKLFGLAALALVLAAPSVVLAAEPSASSTNSYDAKDNGGYVAKEKSEDTDAAGTTTTQNARKEVNVDKDGNKSTTVKIKDTTDPKGLMNKSTTEIQNKAVEKNGKTEYSHKKSVDGKTVEENNENTSQ